jgi:IclR family acetate operon transcriptional repressor
MSEKANGSGVQSVARALDLLEVLAGADGDEMGVSDLATATGLPGATIHRLLATLVARGYVVQQPDSRKYVLGSMLVGLGASAGRRLGAWARPWLVELVALSGETANLAVLEGDAVVYVSQVPSAAHKVRMFTEVGRRLLPHTTAVGKALLAFRPRDEVERLLARTGLPPHTPRTITSAEVFLAELDRVRGRGWSFDDEEEEQGVRCVAVPVLSGGTAAAALSISGPSGRIDGALQARVLPEMRRIAVVLSEAFLSGGREAGVAAAP